MREDLNNKMENEDHFRNNNNNSFKNKVYVSNKKDLLERYDFFKLIVSALMSQIVLDTAVLFMEKMR